MNYTETLNYMFKLLPMYQRQGSAAMKKDLGNIRALCQYLGNPQNNFKSIHLAGTNGKGSSAHMLSAILQEAGYKTGLYTSPHYRDFRERVKINGQLISEEVVIDFVAKHQTFIEALQPSFFEITVALAFEHFAQEEVDVAVIETGLGGRLDSTNIITPLLSIITNIGLDHQQFLGNTLESIAGEKAGIIKKNCPVLIGERQEECEVVFRNKAKEENVPIYWADELLQIQPLESNFYFADYSIDSAQHLLQQLQVIRCDLTGNYQAKNLRTVLAAVSLLEEYFSISPEQILSACAQVKKLSNILGRWQILQEKPTVICDSGHNPAGLTYVIAALESILKDKLHFVLGVVSDKKLDELFPLLPSTAEYYFCKADIPRGMPVEKLHREALDFGLKGNAYTSVKEAYTAALNQASEQDLIFVGGSIFTIAEII